MDERYHKFVLAGGLTLLVVPMREVESVTVLVMVRTGSRDEPTRLSGISHFLEHMVFKGTAKYPTALALTTAIDNVGGEINAFTGKEYTGFYVKLASAHLDLGVDILSQMLVLPRLESSDIEREKQVVFEEIKMHEDLPQWRVSDLFDRLLYGKSGVGRETIGAKETVASLSRGQLVSYLRRRYTRGRTVVGVVGGVGRGKWTKEAIRSLIEKALGGLPPGDDGWGEALAVEQKAPAVSLLRKDTEQGHFIVGVHGLRRGHRDRFAVAVLATLLGGNMSSRLFTEIREKRGLAYSVKSDVDTYFDVGNFSVSAGVHTERIDEAIGVVLSELRAVREEKGERRILESEVASAKEYLCGRFILDLEDSHEVADHFVRRFLLERKLYPPRTFLRKIKAVRRADVVRAARRLFIPRHFNLAVIGKYTDKDGQRWERMLHF